MDGEHDPGEAAAPRRAPEPGGDAPLRLASLAPFLLFGTGRLVERELTLRLADLGLSLRALGILGHLAGSPALSYSELARHSDITVQSMHAAVRRLVADGVVEAVGSAGQTARLTITDAGHALLGRAREVLAGYEAELAAAAGVDVGELRAAAQLPALAAWKVDASTPDLPGDLPGGGPPGRPRG